MWHGINLAGIKPPRIVGDGGNDRQNRFQYVAALLSIRSQLLPPRLKQPSNCLADAAVWLAERLHLATLGGPSNSSDAAQAIRREAVPHLQPDLKTWSHVRGDHAAARWLGSGERGT